MRPLLLVPTNIWRDAAARGWTWGYLNLRHDRGEGIVTIAGMSDGARSMYPIRPGWQRQHISWHVDVTPYSGVWYRVDPKLHELHRMLTRRVDSAISTDMFHGHVQQGWVTPAAGRPYLVVTYTEHEDRRVDLSAWEVAREQAAPLTFSVVDDEALPLDFIAEEWPVSALSAKTVTVVGVGSIGSTVADVLAGAGVGHLAVVDPDRLEQRNLARHRLGPRHLGRLKVRAMAEYLSGRYPATRVDPYPLDVLTAADAMRPLFDASDLVVGTSDGVASRRVINHLARRANTPVILAAVLEDGAFGEIIRVHPGTGCLYCLRLDQIDSETLDPEPRLDLGYGTGSTHRPMTAAPSDLTVVGGFTGKVALSVLLTRSRWNQQLPGDYALVGLQPIADMPEPFDIHRSGDVRWHPLPVRRPDCPTCTPA